MYEQLKLLLNHDFIDGYNRDKIHKLMKLQYRYYKKIETELKVNHYGEWAVVTDESLYGIYPTALEALDAISDKKLTGEFVIQEIIDEETPIVTWHM